METDSSCENNGNAMNKIPIFNFRPPEKTLGMGYGQNSCPVSELKPELHRESSTLSPLMSLNDVSVGYPVQIGDNCIFHPESSAGNSGSGGYYSTEQAHESIPLKIEKVERLKLEQLKLAATLEEQLRLARQLIMQARRDVRQREGKGSMGRCWEEGDKRDEVEEDGRSGNGVGYHDKKEVSFLATVA